MVKFGQNIDHGNIVTPLQGFEGSHPNLAVGTVIGAHLEGHQIDTKRTAQSP
jgi:hypothetical protein